MIFKNKLFLASTFLSFFMMFNQANAISIENDTLKAEVAERKGRMLILDYRVLSSNLNRELNRVERSGILDYRFFLHTPVLASSDIEENMQQNHNEISRLTDIIEELIKALNELHNFVNIK